MTDKVGFGNPLKAGVKRVRPPDDRPHLRAHRHRRYFLHGPGTGNPFAKQFGGPVLLANLTEQVCQMARDAGSNNEEGSAVVTVYERLTGVKVAAAWGGGCATGSPRMDTHRARGSGNATRSGRKPAPIPPIGGPS
jgi:hypothetical protein